MAMTAALMLVFSAYALGQFFISYCHSVLAAYAGVELSEKVRDIIGVNAQLIEGGDFHRVMGLLRIANGHKDDRWDVRAVRAYYRIVRATGCTIARWAPAVRAWSERESQRCSYFAAVALDRRIAALASN